MIFAEVPQREILWNVAPFVMTAVYVLSGLAVGWNVWWFWQRSRLWRMGRNDTPRLRPDWPRLAGYLFTHRTIRRDSYAGAMHALIFWGFIALLIATTLVGIQHHAGFEFLTGVTYLVFSLGADLGGVAFCVGIGMALWRRRSRESHGRLLASRQTTWMLAGLLLLALTGFLVEGARIARDFPEFEIYSPAGYATAKLLAACGITPSAAVRLHRMSWILHAALVIGFFIIVPLTLLRHILVGAYSVAHPTGRPGTIVAPGAPTLQEVGLQDFRQIDLIQADACLTCGRCTEVCPANSAGKPLDPRSIVLGIRSRLDNPTGSPTEFIDADALWSCTTCTACDVACPVNINVVDKIISSRRGLVAAGDIPASAVEALESTAQKFNPFGAANSSRMEWAAGLDVPVATDAKPIELLYWVGCAGAFDPAGRSVSQAMVRLLKEAGVIYRVLGCGERCTGDPARRMGEEELWKELAEHNQRQFAAHRVNQVLTHCAHCYNTFRNEYADVGPMPEVVHHTQWIRDALEAGKLTVRPAAEETVTLHDPCYLARANDETAASRSLLDVLYGDRRVEMEKSGKSAFCCGGGGGQIWLDVRGETRVETIRASHVEETSARTVATGCPYCRVMLEAGREGLPQGQGDWRVRDVAELVVENLKP